MKKDIDRIRDGAKTFEVGDEDDRSPIHFMFSTKEGLYTVKDKSVFITQLADSIDPDRKNIEVPDIHQRVLSHGFDNKIVGKVLVSAERLFHSNILKDVIEKDVAKSPKIGQSVNLATDFNPSYKQAWSGGTINI